MMDVIQEIERQLLMVLLENIPEQSARPKRENESLLNGPQVDTSKAGVVASQDQVDDLLDSLGFKLFDLMALRLSGSNPSTRPDTRLSYRIRLSLLTP